MADVRATNGSESIVHLRDISGTQWKSGLAAWLGWFFDGLDMHLYTLVAAPFVAQLLAVDIRDDAVGHVRVEGDGGPMGRRSRSMASYAACAS